MRKLDPTRAILFYAVLQLTACKNINRDSELRQAWPIKPKPIPLKTIACNLKGETPEDNKILPLMTCKTEFSFTVTPDGDYHSTSEADEIFNRKMTRIGILQLNFGETIQIIGPADIDTSKPAKDRPFYRVLLEKMPHISSCRNQDFAEISHKYLTQECIERLNEIKTQ